MKKGDRIETEVPMFGEEGKEVELVELVVDYFQVLSPDGPKCVDSIKEAREITFNKNDIKLFCEGRLDEVSMNNLFKINNIGQ